MSKVAQRIVKLVKTAGFSDEQLEARVDEAMTNFMDSVDKSRGKTIAKHSVRKTFNLKKEFRVFQDWLDDGILTKKFKQ